MQYLLICQFCGQKHCTDGSDVSNLVEHKTAPVPKRADGKDKTYADLPKKLKCYTCGRLFKIVKVGAPAQKKPELPETLLKPNEDYLKDWESEVLKSIRKKPLN